MRFKSMAVAAVALSMTATPALAATANPAASLSVTKSVRASSPSAKSNELAGSSIVPAVLALAIVAGGIVLVATNDNDKAKSP